MTVPDSLIGRQIDQFRIDQFIASGAMGAVYRAYDTVLHRTVALKLISKDAESTPTKDEARRRLIQEAMAAGRLCHPNIVTIHCYGETADFQYICMEYVMGSTLAELLEQKRVLDIEEAVGILEQVLLALEAANLEHIVHRDIKPSNIMITTDKRVKVMDFGIAKLPSLAVTTTGTVLGTPFYMSPEQISGQKVDIRSDLFSVGAVFYQVLTGQKPFDAESTVTLAYKIVQVEPIPPKVLNIYIPHALEAICKKALAKDPVLRYQTPTEMLKALKELREKGCATSSATDTTIKTKDLFWDKTIQIKRPQVKDAVAAAAPVPSAGAESAPPGPVPREKTAQPPAKEPEPPSAPVEVKALKEEPPAPPSARQSPEPSMEKEPQKGENDQPGPPPSAKASAAKRQEKSAKPEPPKKEKGTSGKVWGVLLTVLLLAIGGFLFNRFRAATPRQVSEPAPAAPSFSTVPAPTDGSSEPPLSPTAPVPSNLPQADSSVPQPPPSSPPAPAALPPAEQPQAVGDQLQNQVRDLLVQAKSRIESDPVAAQKLLEQALSLDPNNPEAILQLARLLTFRKDFQRAIEYYQAALQLNLQAPEIYFNLGYIHMAEGRYQLAIENYERCLRLSPPFADEVLTNLAICHIKTNNIEQAKSLLRKALQLNPNNELAQYYLRTIGSG